MLEGIWSDLERQQLNMTNDWRELHKIPEIGWNLPQTTAFLQRSLDEMNVPWRSFQNKAIIAWVGSGPAILLRAEMDALPVQERGGFTGRLNTRNRHYSGHDLHMAMLLGLARILKLRERELPGQVLLLFYPAGETGMGSKFLVEWGFLEHYPVQTVLALHLTPIIPYGTIDYHAGQCTAYLDGFSIQIQGKGGRGYSPHSAVSPLEIAASIQLLLSSLLQRELAPDQTAVLSIGKAGGGTIPNQIPDKAVVEGTLRCLSDQTRQYLRTRIEEISQGICTAYRGSCSIDFTCTPAVYNDPDLYHRISPLLQARFGDAYPSIAYPMLGADDLCYLSQYVPTAFFLLGSGQPAGNYDEGLLGSGATLLLDALLALWKKK